jgi:hypothetical protein
LIAKKYKNKRIKIPDDSGEFFDFNLFGATLQLFFHTQYYFHGGIYCKKFVF